MINKNDIFTVEITDQDDLGQGIGKVNSFPIFIRHAVTGDIVKITVTKVKKTFGYGRIIEFIKKSDSRVEPPCPVYKRCGGCQLQSMSYDAQLKLKERRVEECLKRIGGCTDIEVLPIIGADNRLRYRNKAQYPVGMSADKGAVCGFYAERTHDIIQCDDCLLTPVEYSDIVKDILSWMNSYGIKAYDEVSGKGLIRHIFIRKGFNTDEIALCLIINGKKLPYKEQLLSILEKYSFISGVSLCINTKRNNVILADEIQILKGERYIRDKIGDIIYNISVLSFFQINPEQTKKLYDKVREFAQLKGTETVIDLYCGIGTISLYLAEKAKKLYGIEIVPQAIDDAKSNAELNKITNADFYVGKAEEVLPELYKKGLKKADIVVVDPPRKGCDELTLSTIADIAPEKLIYVSCNPATLARDIKYLRDKGYIPQKVQPVDMFPMTTHVETVCLLSRNK